VPPISRTIAITVISCDALRAAIFTAQHGQAHTLAHVDRPAYPAHDDHRHASSGRPSRSLSSDGAPAAATGW
jgi:hypothetical protein